MNKRIYIITIFLIMSVTQVFAQNADQIIQNMDNASKLDSFRANGKLIINNRFGTKTSTFEYLSRKGGNEILITFTSAAERGQKVLRTDKEEVYLYYPEAEDVIRIKGAALKQSLMGSDASYEDLTSDKSTLDDYTATLEGNELIDGKDCYVIILNAKQKNIAYLQKKLWIEKKTYVPLQTQMYAGSGKLLKTMRIKETIQVAGRTLASRSILEDKLKKDTSSEYILENIQANIPLSDDDFSLDALSF